MEAQETQGREGKDRAATSRFDDVSQVDGIALHIQAGVGSTKTGYIHVVMPTLQLKAHPRDARVVIF